MSNAAEHLTNRERTMRVLNLYAGLGGNRKLWEGCEVVAVESHEKIAEVYQRLHPEDDVIVGDAHEYLRPDISETLILYGLVHHARRIREWQRLHAIKTAITQIWGCIRRYCFYSISIRVIG